MKRNADPLTAFVESDQVIERLNTGQRLSKHNLMAADAELVHSASKASFQREFEALSGWINVEDIRGFCRQEGLFYGGKSRWKLQRIVSRG